MQIRQRNEWPGKGLCRPAPNMGERGVPLQIVEAMVGRMSTRMVRYYTHISNRAAREAVEPLDNASRVMFVGKLVGETKDKEEPNAKLLN